MTDKLTRKEIKGPDEFQVWVGKAIEFFRLYGAWVGAAAVVVLVAIVGGVLLSRHADSSRLEVAKEFDAAFAPVVAAELQRPEAQAEAPAPEDAAKKAQDDAAKLKAAAQALDQVATKHKDDPVGKAAVLGKAAAALNAGDAATAAQAYQGFVQANPESPMNIVVWESLGLAADRAGNRADAEKAFNEMAKAPSGLIRAYAFLHLGDLYNPATRAKAGDPVDPAKAREFYEKGAKEVEAKEDEMLSPAPLLAKKTLEERLLSLR